MAAENKQLGTLTLDAKGVLATINQVNSALKNLGKGVDLDITSIMNQKVARSLAKLQSQIDTIGAFPDMSPEQPEPNPEETEV